MRKGAEVASGARDAKSARERPVGGGHTARWCPVNGGNAAMRPRCHAATLPRGHEARRARAPCAPRAEAKKGEGAPKGALPACAARRRRGRRFRRR